MLRQAGEGNFDSAPCILAEEGKKTEAEMRDTEERERKKPSWTLATQRCNSIENKVFFQMQDSQVLSTTDSGSAYNKIHK